MSGTLPPLPLVSLWRWYVQLHLLRDERSGDRIPVVARFSAPVQTGPRAHPASHTMGTGYFPGVKRPRHGVDHPPHLAPRLKKEYSYNSNPHLWAFVACYRVKFTFTFYLYGGDRGSTVDKVLCYKSEGRWFDPSWC